ncbi:MAG TPA: hypothetical protein VF412_06300 [Bdellovibrio sp.]|uniref:hypothetical protein n=1 Tax=Bdellovibrio sp. TaxID=28201 RepID=UPI002EDD150C
MDFISSLFSFFLSEEKRTFLLHEHIRISLKKYPELRAQIPAAWPAHTKYDITDKRMKAFQQDRLNKNLEGMNMVLMLHNLESFSTNRKSKEVFSSIFEAIEWFCKEMIGKPGAKTIIEPLWTSSWDPLRFWGVVSEIFYTKMIVSNGFQIDGFDRTITGSTKTADIATIWKGTKTWIDIEALALKTISGSDADFRKLVEDRANKKMNDKFSAIDPNDLGVVASIYRLTNKENLSKFKYLNDATKPVGGPTKNVGTNIYWLVVGKHIEPSEGEGYALHLVDRTKKTEVIKDK